ncbi:MAG: hypothetical protein PUK54_06155 [Firmicutes bacterium]|nr:hypothetical protein [Bacillota bacterium]MDD7602168.1 hypothetical protein [Bacillota bacterium]MDY5857343.1 hypothetical protein [Anaerovoracaceae bacterium]
MGTFTGTIRKIFFLGVSAVLGAALGFLLSASFTVVEVGSSDMLPTLEPGEKAIVLRDCFVDQYETGDLVACRAPYHTVYDGGNYLIRRVTGSRDGWIRLDCDAKTARTQERMAEKTEILGKVIASFHRVRSAS